MKGKAMPHLGYRTEWQRNSFYCLDSVYWCFFWNCFIKPTLIFTPPACSRSTRETVGTSSSPEAMFTNITTLKFLICLFLAIWTRFQVRGFTVLNRPRLFIKWFEMFRIRSPLPFWHSRFAFSRKFLTSIVRAGNDKRDEHFLPFSRPCGFFQTTQSQSGAHFCTLSAKSCARDVQFGEFFFKLLLILSMMLAGARI